MQIRNSRWLPMAILAFLTSYTAQSWALGLGEMEVDSALNERFSASAELLDARGLQPTEVLVSMASREDFDRVGVERFFYLTDLQFNVDLNHPQGPRVTVSSSQPVSEPYLNFIVEVQWPNGRMLKEFTVLLDPPTFSQAPAPAVRAPVQVTESEPEAVSNQAQNDSRRTTQVTVPQRVDPRPAPRRDAQKFSSAQQPSGGRILTTRDDTLWTIASRTLPSQRVTVNQQMLAIQRLNRSAFIRDNINLLKAGYNLQLPDENESLSMSEADADYNVANQSNAWKTRADTQLASAPPRGLQDDADNQLRSQVDATSRSAAQSANSSDGQGQVRILASDGDNASGAAEKSEPKVNQLIEQADTLNRQVDELTYQLDRERDIASNQVEVKDRQLEVKNQEIAELQQQLGQMREQLAERAKQNQSTEPTPVAQEWWQSPMLLMGVIGVLILLLIGLLIAMRRSRGQEQYEDYDEDITEDDLADDVEVAEYEEASDAYSDVAEANLEDEDRDIEPSIGVAAVGSVASTLADDEILTLDDDTDDDAGAIDNLMGASDDSNDLPQTETSDVIGEAEIYIAYGRYGQAANLLLGVLKDNPEMYDVRLKLLEVFVESGDSTDFAEHAQYILDNCDDEEVLLACRDLEGQLEDTQIGGELDDQVQDTQTTAGDEESSEQIASLDDLDSGIAALADGDDLLEGLEELEDANTQEIADELDEDFSALLDDDLDSAGEDDLSAVGDLGGALDSDDEEFELEFDVDDLEVDTNTDSGDALGGDLGMDFDPDRDVDSTLSDEDEIDSAALDELLAGLDDDDGLETESGLDNAATTTATEGLEEADELADFGELGGGDLGSSDLGSSDLGSSDLGSSDLASSDEGSGDEEFEFDATADADINATKIDLAEAYIDMGDVDGARDILLEVVDEGLPEQKEKAQHILDGMPN